MSVRAPASTWCTPRLASLAGAVPLALLGLAGWIAAGAYNRPLFLVLNTWAAAQPESLWSCLTIMGTGAGAYAILAPWQTRAPRLMMAALAGGVFGGLFTHLIKPLVHTARPAAEISASQIHIIGETLTHNAFPSGHSVTAFAVAGLVVSAARRPMLVAACALPLAGLVALSRIAVGAHWPVDILVGAAGGWLCGIAGERLSRRWHFWSAPGARLLFALAILGNGIGLLGSDLGYPQANTLRYLLALVCMASTAMALTALWQDWLRWNGRRGHA